MEDQRDFLVLVFQAAEVGPFFRLFHHQGKAFGNRFVFHRAVGQNVPPGNRHAVNLAVQLRQRSGDRGLHRVQPFGVFPPVFFRRQQRVRREYRHAEFLELVDGQAAVADLREFHGTDQRVDDGFPVRREEVCEHLANARHAQRLVGELVREHRDCVAALPLRFGDEGGGVSEVVPDPFVAVEQQTQRRPVCFAVFFPVRGEVGGIALGQLRMVDAGPAALLRFLRRGDCRVRQRRGVEPEVLEILCAAVKGVPLQPRRHRRFHAGALLVLRVRRALHCVQEVRDFPRRQERAARLPERGLGDIAEESRDHEARAAELALPDVVPLAGAFEHDRHAEVGDFPVVLQGEARVLHARVAAGVVRQIDDLGFHSEPLLFALFT